MLLNYYFFVSCVLYSDIELTPKDPFEYISSVRPEEIPEIPRNFLSRSDPISEKEEREMRLNIMCYKQCTIKPCIKIY